MMASDHTLSFEQANTPDDGKLHDQREKMRWFRKRLRAQESVLLPEVWDVVSSRVVADAGFDLIGISSVAVAWSQGIGRRERLPLDTLAALAQRIARDSKVPINADLEGILGRSPEEIARAVETVAAAGCIGVVIGDGGRSGAHGIAPIKEMTAAIRAAKSAAAEKKVPAVITARTEAFLLEPPPHSPFETAVERAEAYFEAGADCMSVPGVQHIQIIERLAGQIDGPLCVTVGLAPAPDVKALKAAGASCIALGSALMRSLLGTMRFKAEELLAFGQFNNLNKAISVEALEALLS